MPGSMSEIFIVILLMSQGMAVPLAANEYAALALSDRAMSGASPPAIAARSLPVLTPPAGVATRLTLTPGLAFSNSPTRHWSHFSESPPNGDQ